MGEFAQYVNGEFGIGCDLHVIPAEGWKRSWYADETDLPWLLPSPSLNSCTANLLYAGMCVFEGVSTISEGRGTSKPFELIGAPWADGYELAARMNRKGLEGVPSKMDYVTGDTLNLAGMQVTATLTNGLTRDITKLFTAPARALTAQDAASGLTLYPADGWGTYACRDAHFDYGKGNSGFSADSARGNRL